MTKLQMFATRCGFGNPTRGSHPRTAFSQPEMILKMNFNFNSKDMLRQAKQSIRTLTIARDWNHSVGITG